MLRNTLASLILLAGGPAIAADSDKPKAETSDERRAEAAERRAETTEEEVDTKADLSPLATSIKLEVEIIRAVNSRLSEMAKDRGAKMPEGAQKARDEAKQFAERARNYVDEKQYGQAYRAIRHAWKAQRPIVMHVLEKGPDGARKALAEKMVSALSERISELKSMTSGQANEAAQAHFAKATELWEAAKAQRAEGATRDAFQTVQKAYHEIHLGLVATWRK